MVQKAPTGLADNDTVQVTEKSSLQPMVQKAQKGFADNDAVQVTEKPSIQPMVQKAQKGLSDNDAVQGTEKPSIATSEASLSADKIRLAAMSERPKTSPVYDEQSTELQTPPPRPSNSSSVEVRSSIDDRTYQVSTASLSPRIPVSNEEHQQKSAAIDTTKAGTAPVRSNYQRLMEPPIFEKTEDVSTSKNSDVKSSLATAVPSASGLRAEETTAPVISASITPKAKGDPQSLADRSTVPVPNQNRIFPNEGDRELMPRSLGSATLPTAKATPATSSALLTNADSDSESAESLTLMSEGGKPATAISQNRPRDSESSVKVLQNQARLVGRGDEVEADYLPREPSSASRLPPVSTTPPSAAPIVSSVADLLKPLTPKSETRVTPEKTSLSRTASLSSTVDIPLAARPSLISSLPAPVVLQDEGNRFGAASTFTPLPLPTSSVPVSLPAPTSVSQIPPPSDESITASALMEFGDEFTTNLWQERQFSRSLQRKEGAFSLRSNELGSQHTQTSTSTISPSTLSATSPTSSIATSSSSTNANAVNASPLSVLTASNPQISAQLAQRLVQLVQQGQEQASLRIDPPELGPLELKIRLAQDQLDVQFIAHDALVRERVQDSLPRLRDLLNQQGFNLADANVADSGGQSSAFQQSNGFARQQEAPKSSDSTGKTSVETPLPQGVKSSTNAGRLHRYV